MNYGKVNITLVIITQIQNWNTTTTAKSDPFLPSPKYYFLLPPKRYFLP